MKNKEDGTLYKEIVDKLNAEKFPAYRIQDGSFGKKPYDIQAFTDTGLGLSIEVKVISNETPAPTPHVKLYAAHQLNWLQLVTQAGGYGVAYERYKNKTGHTDMLYLMHKSSFSLNHLRESFHPMGVELKEGVSWKCLISYFAFWQCEWNKQWSL